MKAPDSLSIPTLLLHPAGDFCRGLAGICCTRVLATGDRVCLCNFCILLSGMEESFSKL